MPVDNFKAFDTTFYRFIISNYLISGTSEKYFHVRIRQLSISK